MNKLKGDNYELQIKNYIINELNKKAYLWHETPEDILIKFGIIGSHNEHRLRRKTNKENNLVDTGIDIIQIDDENKCSLVQCKNGYNNGLSMNDLSGFMCWMSSLSNLNGYVYYTNKLSRNIKELPYTNRITYIKKKYIEEQNIIIESNIIKPYDYQLKALKKFKKKFTNRGILSLPCGTGKTYITYLCSLLYKQIIILSPLKQFAKQNLEKFIYYGYNNNTLLVNSDGERDIDNINKFINTNEYFLISATYCSVDIISKLKLDNLLIIIDEFHNLSKNNVTDENNDFYKLLYSNYNILFVSATPRVYELENEDYNDSIFGNTIYNMTFNDAIKNKYITDYQIWLPSINDYDKQLEDDISIYNIDNIIKAKCNYLYSCIIKNGSRKCIIYCTDINEINSMINGMEILNQYYYLDYKINQLTSKNTEVERNNVLNNFTNNNKIQLLFSVRILDECIDIPSCDSIYITYPTKSKIRTIQRLSRCIRIDKNNKFKIGNIFIWCNQYDIILDTLSGIKEYDIFFKDKIQLNNNNIKKKKNIYINNKKTINNYIIGIKQYKYIKWTDKLELVKKYIIKNKKIPSTIDKNEDIKLLGVWLSNQLSLFRKNEQIMTNQNIKNIFNDFINKYLFDISNKIINNILDNKQNIENKIIITNKQNIKNIENKIINNVLTDKQKKNKKQYICNICNKNYSCNQSLWYHNKQFHTNNNNNKILNKSLTCEYCNKIFNTRAAKSYHKKKCVNLINDNNNINNTTNNTTNNITNNKIYNTNSNNTINNNTINNNTTSNSNNNSNNNIQINNIIINPFGKENIMKIAIKDIKKITRKSFFL